MLSLFVSQLVNLSYLVIQTVNELVKYLVG